MTCSSLLLAVLVGIPSAQGFSFSFGGGRSPARPLAFVSHRQVADNPLFRLSVNFRPEGDEDDDEEEDTSESRLRKRDRIKDWFSTNSDGDDDRSPRIKARFDNLFSGMPSVGDILTEKTQDELNMASEEIDAEIKKDPEWFEQEKKRIMER